MTVRRSRRFPAVGRMMLAAALVTVIGLSGCAGSQTVVAGSTESSATSTTPTSATSSADDAPTDVSAEVARLVNLYLSAKSADADQIESVLVNVNGEDLFTYYSADSGPTVTHNTYSVTKSVMSMLVGIAISEGSIRSVDQTLAELLPTRVATMAPGVGAVTLGQLLTMTGGIAGEEDATGYTADANWVAVTLGTPLTQPAGTEFVYSDYGAHLISAILVEATGRSVFDFASEKLFTPLGISTEPAAQPFVPEADVAAYDATPGFGWPVDPQGLNLGGGGIKITGPDRITLGRLYLQQGRWEGQQLVPADWVAESTSQMFETYDWVGGYGYFWWLPRQGEHPAFAALGYAGQLIEVVPDLNLVVAVSCTNPVATGRKPLDAAGFAGMVDEQIVPVLAKG